jgi:hypothetical protein
MYIIDRGFDSTRRLGEGEPSRVQPPFRVEECPISNTSKCSRTGLRKWYERLCTVVTIAVSINQA